MRNHALVVVMMVAGTAHADLCSDANGRNILVGPILGWKPGGKSGLIVGVEGGVGCGTMRLNAGFEYRDHKGLTYVEFDPWFLLGASFGLGVDTDGELTGIIGTWEAVPLVYQTCRHDTQTIAMLSFGYRYTGVHELYISVKAGELAGDSGCLD